MTSNQTLLCILSACTLNDSNEANCKSLRGTCFYATVLCGHLWISVAPRIWHGGSQKVLYDSWAGMSHSVLDK